MILNEELKLKLVKRLCKTKGIKPTDAIIELMMSFPYRVIAKPLILIDASTGKFTHKQLADNYNLTVRQVSYMVNCEIYD